MNNKLTMDNLDDEFETSWNNNSTINVESTINADSTINVESTINADSTINVKTDIKPITENSSENKKMTALEALVNIRTPDKKTENFEEKINQLKEQGKQMLDDYKERGILVNDIDESMIIKDWEDCKYLNANTNVQYLDKLVKSVINYGYESPRPIQCITAGRIAKKGDLIVQAKAGNGKTAAFVFGSAIGINPTQYKTQVLILSPTQLLTDQTTEVVNNLTAQTGITVHCHRGGLPLVRDNKVAHIIVGCPGRIIDLIKRKKINLNYFVLYKLNIIYELLFCKSLSNSLISAIWSTTK